MRIVIKILDYIELKITTFEKYFNQSFGWYFRNQNKL